MPAEPFACRLPGAPPGDQSHADPGALIGALGTLQPDASVLWGSWFGPRRSRSVIVLPTPLERHTGLDAEAAIAALVEAGTDGLQPRGGPAASPGVLGGGWLIQLGYAPRTSRLEFHDLLLRWRSDLGWQFESLGLPGREAAVAAELERWRELLAGPFAAPLAAPGFAVGDFSTLGDPAAARLRHLAGVEEVIGRIDRGDCYQLNLCTRLHAAFDGDPAAAFAAMAGTLDPELGAFSPGTPALLSFSPELFLRAVDGQVTTGPIKGTAPRGPQDDASSSSARALLGSAKDIAENIMITDLMRNDLSRVSMPGTVEVDRPLELQPHPGVWHLVSTVTGRLVAGVGAADLLRATFPPGSVTGAPKGAAIRAIGEFESESREVYTGAFGLLSPWGGLQLSVVIRTLELLDGQLSLGVGGGITVDSVPVAEWAECLHKAAPLVTAAGAALDPALVGPTPPPTTTQLAGGVFETMLSVGGAIPHLAGHLARIDRSTRELYGSGLPDALAGEVRALAAGSRGRQAVRVTARPGPEGLHWGCTIAPTAAPAGAADLVHRDRTSGCWRHKWLDRAELSRIEQATPGAVPYFTAADDQVSETVRSNIFWLDPEHGWCTPPLTDDVLPGVTRRHSIDLLADAGREPGIVPLPRARLGCAEGVFVTSSLSGAVEVRTVDGRPVPSCAEVVAIVNSGLGLR